MSEAAVDSRTVTLAEAKTRILDAFEIQQPVFLWGLPGVGKSELMEQICSERRNFRHHSLPSRYSCCSYGAYRSTWHAIL